MADYATEDEQLEALKRWWEENARSVIFGIILAVVGVSGWQGWQWYTDTQSENAASVYRQIQNQMPMGDPTQVLGAAETLRSDFGRTNYAALGAMAAARVLARQGDYTGAADWLEWVVDNAREDSLQAIARVRLARVLGEQGDTDAALDLLRSDAPPGWAAMHREVSGDLFAMRGDHEQAAEEYEQALATDGTVSDRELVRLKLNRVRAGRDIAGVDLDS